MTSPIDAKLRTQAVLRRAEVLARTGQVVEQIQRKFLRILDRLSRMRDGGLEQNVRRSRRIVLPVQDELLGLMEKHLMGLARFSYEHSTRTFVRFVPRSYWRVLRRLPVPESVGMQEMLSPADLFRVGPIDATDLFGPVRRKELTDKEVEDALLELIFPPMTPERIAAILAAQFPQTSETWRNAITRVTGRASLDQIIQQAVLGMAEGDNVQQLTERLRPIVGHSEAQARNVARRASMWVAEQAQRDSWAHVDDLMVGAQIIAILDSRTRSHHAARHGTVFFKPGFGPPDAPRLADMPFLPDEPWCRCMSTPVLRPPDEVLNDPAAAVQYRSLAGDVPNPEDMIQWWDAAPDENKKFHVGARRFETVKGMLGDTRPPEYPDFLDTDGRLLTIKRLKSESPQARERRRAKILADIRHNAALYRQVASQGFLTPS